MASRKAIDVCDMIEYVKPEATEEPTCGLPRVVAATFPFSSTSDATAIGEGFVDAIVHEE
jgi:hypothetical protein